MRRFGSRLLAEPDLECYTIRLPARVFRRGTGERVQRPVDSARVASGAAPSVPRTAQGGHADGVKRAGMVVTDRVLSV